jgi:hypothetical protein
MNNEKIFIDLKKINETLKNLNAINKKLKELNLSTTTGANYQLD